MLFEKEKLMKSVILDLNLLSEVEANGFALLFIVTGAIFLIAALIQQKYPPKRINAFYGHRTKRSMRNQEVWKYAQEYSSKKMKQMAFCMLVVGGMSCLVTIQNIWGVCLGIIGITLLPIWLFVEVEKELKKRFPKK